MSEPRETNLALFIDFDNLAIGARDARQRLDIKLLIQRILEKGKIIVKRAYADWHHHKEHMSALHEAAIDLIEVPAPRISGKNSADIRMVVDAMDLCYAKEHVDTFVICSGDSDFSPLVSKLRENNKRVIGVGMKNSSSNLLIGNCDEFIFYDDIYRQNQAQPAMSGGNMPLGKREMFDLLLQTVRSLLHESRDVLYSSLIKDTMKRKQPHFSERALGYATFGDVLEEARNLGLLKVERDARSGGTWVVHGLGPGTAVEAAATGARPAAVAPAVSASATSAAPAAPGSASRSSRRRRRSGRGGSGARANGDGAAENGNEPSAESAAPVKTPATAPAPTAAPASETASRTASRTPPATPAAPGEAAPARKKTVRKTTRKAVSKAAPKAEVKTEVKPDSKSDAKAAPARKTTRRKAGSGGNRKVPAAGGRGTTKKTSD